MNTAVILASGSGSRTGLNIPKQFLKIAGREILDYSLRTFLACKAIDEVIITVPAEYLHDVSSNYPDCRVIIGGVSRRESSKLAALAASPASRKILIHDAARPFLTEQIITDALDLLHNYTAVAPCIDSRDTLIRKEEQGIDILDRERIKAVQTPQGFHTDKFIQAHSTVTTNVTDDMGLMRIAFPEDEPCYFEGEKTNFKITDKYDFLYAEALAAARLREFNEG